MNEIYVSLSVVALVSWIVTQITWLRRLRSANGTRPFINLTLAVGTLNTIVAIIFVSIAFYKVPEDNWIYAAGMAYMVISLITCALMWQLQHKLHDVKTHVSMRTEEQSHG